MVRLGGGGGALRLRSQKKGPVGSWPERVVPILAAYLSL